MKPVTSPPPGSPVAKQCADRVEVERDMQHVPAATVRTWVEHLRSHGWADKDIEPIWTVRARQGVMRWGDGDGSRASQPTAGR
jgi:hypothetical protein